MLLFLYICITKIFIGWEMLFFRGKFDFDANNIITKWSSVFLLEQ